MKRNALIISGIVLVLAVGWFAHQEKQRVFAEGYTLQPTSDKSTIVSVFDEEHRPVDMDISDWKIYRNEKFGFQFRLPQNVKVELDLLGEEPDESTNLLRIEFPSKESLNDPVDALAYRLTGFKNLSVLVTKHLSNDRAITQEGYGVMETSHYEKWTLMNHESSEVLVWRDNAVDSRITSTVALETRNGQIYLSFVAPYIYDPRTVMIVQAFIASVKAF